MVLDAGTSAGIDDWRFDDIHKLIAISTINATLVELKHKMFIGVLIEYPQKCVIDHGMGSAIWWSIKIKTAHLVAAFAFLA